MPSKATVNRTTAPSSDNASDYVSKAQRDLAKPQKLPVRRPVRGRDSCDIAGDNHRPGGRFHCQSEHTLARDTASLAPHARAVARLPKVPRRSAASTGWGPRNPPEPSLFSEPLKPAAAPQAAHVRIRRFLANLAYARGGNGPSGGQEAGGSPAHSAAGFGKCLAAGAEESGAGATQTGPGQEARKNDYYSYIGIANNVKH